MALMEDRTIERVFRRSLTSSTPPGMPGVYRSSQAIREERELEALVAELSGREGGRHPAAARPSAGRSSIA